MSDDLNQAIELVQQHQDAEAQAILQDLIRANPQDLAAWSWYVKSCRTPEKRLEALEVSLRFNPGNTQILEAIRKIKEKIASQESPAFTIPEPDAPEAYSSQGYSPEPYTSQPPSAVIIPAPDVPGAYSSSYSADDFPYASPYSSGGYVSGPPSSSFDPAPYTALSTPTVDSQDESRGKLGEFTGLDDTPGRPFIWYDVWIKALTKPNVATYTALLRDPLAGIGRIIWWTLIAGLVSGMVAVVSLLQNPIIKAQIDDLDKGSKGTETSLIVGGIMLGVVLLSAVMSVPSLMLSAAIYNLLAKMFGGTGNFIRTFYLMGAFLAPYTIIVQPTTLILSLIPCLICLVVPFLLFYNFTLMSTSIQAAHRLNGGRAWIVVLIPVLLLFLCGCISGVLFPQVLSEAFSEYSPN